MSFARMGCLTDPCRLGDWLDRFRSDASAIVLMSTYFKSIVISCLQPVFFVVLSVILVSTLASQVVTPGPGSGPSAKDSVSDQQKLIRDRLASARRAEDAGQATTAISSLQSILASHASCRLRAKACIALGRLELQVGHYALAANAADAALRVGFAPAVLSPLEAGTAELVEARATDELGSDSSVEASLKRSIQFFSDAGDPGRPLMLRAYSDLTILYVQRRDFHSADDVMNRALQESNRIRTTPEEHVLVEDTLFHLENEEGKTTAALKRATSLCQRYGVSPELNADFRAHLYEDMASLKVREHNFDDATSALNTSIALRKTSPNQLDCARALLLLARVQIQQSNLTKASESLQNANGRLQASEESLLDRIVADETYGMLLNREHKWSAARLPLQNAIQLGARNANFVAVCVAALQELITADSHLHLRKEERSAKKQVQALSANLQIGKPGSTVDLADLKDSYKK